MYVDNSPITVFDAEKLYDRDIRPLVDEIKKICIMNKVPFFVTTVVKSTTRETKYEMDGILTGSTDIHLKDDRFERLLMVCRGAKVKPVYKDAIENEGAMEYIDSIVEVDPVDDTDDSDDDIGRFVPTIEEEENPPADSKEGRPTNMFVDLSDDPDASGSGLVMMTRDL